MSLSLILSVLCSLFYASLEGNSLVRRCHQWYIYANARTKNRDRSLPCETCYYINVYTRPRILLIRTTALVKSLLITYVRFPFLKYLNLKTFLKTKTSSNNVLNLFWMWTENLVCVHSTSNGAYLKRFI